MAQTRTTTIITSAISTAPSYRCRYRCISLCRHVCTQLKPHNQVREKDENFDNLWLFKLTCVLNNQNLGVFSLLVPFSNRHFMFYCCFVQQRNRFVVPRFRSIFLSPAPCRPWSYVCFSICCCWLPFVCCAAFWNARIRKTMTREQKRWQLLQNNNISVGKVHVLHILSVTYHGACCIWMPEN